MPRDSSGARRRWCGARLNNSRLPSFPDLSGDRPRRLSNDELSGSLRALAMLSVDAVADGTVVGISPEPAPEARLSHRIDVLS